MKKLEIKSNICFAIGVGLISLILNLSVLYFFPDASDDVKRIIQDVIFFTSIVSGMLILGKVKMKTIICIAIGAALISLLSNLSVLYFFPDASDNIKRVIENSILIIACVSGGLIIRKLKIL